MNELIVAFITGLTTGGLSCLAVQGGLLASSMASQIEADISGEKSTKQVQMHVAAPILWFLLAKLIAYTFLGFLLGWIGSMIQLSPIPRAILQIAIGIFMLGNALRLLNVHPIFRYFNIEPPAFIRKYIRNKSKQGGSFITPVFLGALTVLIPCGITQVMMAASIASGDPIRGATLMFAFILGTSPIFFVVAYFATRLGSVLEKYFMKFVAVVVLVLGLITINTGLNLMGSPLAFERIVSRFIPGSQLNTANNLSPLSSGIGLTSLSGSSKSPSSTTGGCGCGMMKQGSGAVGSSLKNPLLDPVVTPVATQPAPADETYAATINVQNTGYDPGVLEVKAGVPLKITFKSDQIYSCSLAIVIPSQNIQFYLKSTDTQTIQLPPMKSGEQLPYSCSMGMYTGTIVAR